MTKAMISYVLFITGFLFLYNIGLGQEDRERPIALAQCERTYGLNNDCTLEIQASDVDGGSYNENGGNLSFKLHLIDDNGDFYEGGSNIVFYCDQVGVLVVALEVINEDGLKDTCSTVIEIQQGNCVDPSCDGHLWYPAILQGNFTTSTGIPINGVELYVDGQYGGEFNQKYCLPIEIDPQTGLANAVLEAFKEDDIRNGVSTLDLIYIRRDILQLVPLPSHYSKVAGDVNKDHKVSTLDMIQIRQAVLRQIDNYTGVPNWRFIRGDYSFGADTWSSIIPFYYEIDNEYEIEQEMDFIGVKMGDVNFSADATRRSTGTYEITLEDQWIQPNQEVEVQWQWEKEIQFEGYQLELEMDTEKLEFLGIEGLSEQEYHLINKGSTILISKIHDEEVYNSSFSIRLHAKKECYLSEGIELGSKYLDSEGYEKDQLGTYDLDLSWDGEEKEFCLFGNRPNPTTNQTTISYHSNTKSTAKIRIYNLSGHRLYEVVQKTEKGCNEWMVDLDDLGLQSGLYIYSVETSDRYWTGRCLKD